MQVSLRTVALLAFALGAAALVYFYARAAADGQRRADDTALEALRPDYQGEDRLAPDFTLRDRRGKAVKLSHYRGKVVVLNFWTITCGPCVEEMPTLEELQRIVDHEDDVVLVTVTVDDDWHAVRRLFPGGTKMTVLFDPERSIVKQKFGTDLFPETWIIDPSGVIRARFDGPRDWSSGVAVDYIRSLTRG